jgi:hypothetical protein
MRLLAAGLLLLLLAGGLWLAVGGRRGPGDAAEPVSPGVPLKPGLQSGPQSVPRVPERVEQATTEPGPVPAPGGLEDEPPPAPPDLSARFAGYSPESLREHLREVELKLSAEQDVAFKRRFDAGLFETHAVDVERGDWDLLAQRAPAGELGRGRLRFGEPGPDGKRPAQYQLARLPRAEYPALYALVDERDWLRAELARLGADEDR